jgi:colanic acid biosynthesis glycosyl transferase WcaI
MPSQKTILLIAGNYFPEPTGIGRYNKEMTDWLADNDFACTVITTYPYYPHWKVQPPYDKDNWWYKKESIKTKSGNVIKVYRCPHFIPKNITAKTRIISDITFVIAVSFILLFFLFKKKYDYVMNVTPPLAPGILAVLYKRLKKAKFVYHIQDLQADAARELHLIRSKKLLGYILKLENKIIWQADVVSTISQGMAAKLKEKTKRQVIIFPNWTDTKLFYPINRKSMLKELYGFKATDKVILYSGAIGEKQGLELMLHIARHFETKENYRFVIAGTGPYKQKLEAAAKTQGLQNVCFLPLQPEEDLNHFLNMADLHLIMQKAGITDLMMPSKLTNILAVGGLALVTANGTSSLYTMVKNHGIALSAKPENQQNILDKIETALTAPHENIKKNARLFAEQNLSSDTVLAEYAKLAFSNER